MPPDQLVYSIFDVPKPLADRQRESHHQGESSTMAFEDLASLYRHNRMRVVVLVAALVIVVIWVSAQFLQPGPSRRIVLASGAESGIYHQYALRYKEILGREGVKVDLRMTGGA